MRKPDNYAEYVKLQEDTSCFTSRRKAYAEREITHLDIMLRMCSPQKDYNILEVGCGDGLGVRYLHSLGYTNTFGIDISEPKISEAIREYGTPNVFMADIMYPHNILPSLPKKFNLIYSFHTLEHMLNVDLAFANIIKLTNRGSKIFTVVPNEQISGIEERTPQHCSPFNQRRMLRFLLKMDDRHGLRVIYFRTVVGTQQTLGQNEIIVLLEKK